MRSISFIGFYLMISLSLTVHIVTAQIHHDTKATIDLTDLIVDNKGQMLAFDADRVFKADSFGSDWVLKAEILGKSKDKYASSLIKQHCLFNTDTFLLSGYLVDSLQGKSYILRTVDGGTTFQKIYPSTISNNHFIDAAFCNKQGQSWLAHTDLGILFSSDYGLTWQQIGKQTEQRLRISSIFFKDAQTGIITADDWGLYLTNDNCKTFKTIPPPYYQQKKLKDRKPLTIVKALLYNDWIIVRSSYNQWFYTKANTIHWRPLSDMVWLYFDKESQELWGITLNYQLVQFNKQLTISWRSAEKLKDLPHDLRPMNGDLYCFLGESLCKVNKTSFKRVLNYQKGVDIQVPLANRSKTQSITWGWDNRNIYQSEDLGQTWYRVQEFSYVYEPQFNALNDSIILIYDRCKMERFEYNHKTQLLSPCTLTHLFDDFLTSKINKVTISEDGRGCFLYNSLFIDYKWNTQGKYFESDSINKGIPTNDNNGLYKVDTIKTIPFQQHFTYSAIDSFMSRLNQEPEKQLTWANFKMTKADAKRFLKESKHFDKYKMLQTQRRDARYWDINTASLKDIAKNIVKKNNFDDALLKTVFNSYDRYHSTAREWVSLIIQNERGEKIEFTSGRVYKFPYYITWTAKYKDWEFKTADIDIFKFMSALSPKTFWEKATNENWAVYMEIAQYLCLERMGKD